MRRSDNRLFYGACKGYRNPHHNELIGANIKFKGLYRKPARMTATVEWLQMSLPPYRRTRPRPPRGTRSCYNIAGSLLQSRRTGVRSAHCADAAHARFGEGAPGSDRALKPCYSESRSSTVSIGLCVFSDGVQFSEEGRRPSSGWQIARGERSIAPFREVAQQLVHPTGKEACTDSHPRIRQSRA